MTEKEGFLETLDSYSSDDQTLNNLIKLGSVCFSNLYGKTNNLVASIDALNMSAKELIDATSLDEKFAALTDLVITGLFITQILGDEQ